MRIEIEARVDYVEKMVAIGLWYVCHQLHSGRCSENEVHRLLTTQTKIYSLTTLFDGVNHPSYGFKDRNWDHLVATLSSLVVESTPGDTAVLERKGVQLLWPWLSPRIELDANMCPEPEFGFWDYELISEGAVDGPGVPPRWRNRRLLIDYTRRAIGLGGGARRHVCLHFKNVKAPESPFRSRQELVDSLRELISECMTRHPRAHFLWVSSWLFGIPVFWSLFPREMVDNGWSTPVSSDDSWWGQFMTKEGGFNNAFGDLFRRNGEFPYPRIKCRGKLAEIDRHLSEL